LNNNLQILEDNLANLPTILAEYETELNKAESLLEIKGRTLERANVEQSSWQYFYDVRKRELGSILKYLNMRVEKTRAKLFRSYVETHNRELSDRTIDKYVNNEEAYLSMYQLYLEVSELYEKYDAVVEAFRSRGYALNNITKIRVASLEDVTI